MINRRLVFLLATAIALGAFSAWVDGGSFLGTSKEHGKAASGTPSATALQTQAAAPAGRNDVSLNPLSDIRIESLSEMVDRPLFNPSRAPAKKEPLPEPEVEPVVEAEPAVAVDMVDPGEFTLLAVASDGNDKTAVVRSNSNNEIFHLKPGEFLSGLQVMQVGHRDITLARQGQSFKLELFQRPESAAPQADAETAGAPQTESAGGGQLSPDEQ